MTAENRILRFEPDVREWAVRVAALEMKDGDPADVLVSVARRVGCTPATVRRWMREAERAGGIRPGVFTNPRRRVAELEDEVARLRAEKARLQLEARRRTLGDLLIGGPSEAPVARRA
ncbi:transposase [Sphingopyxis fribergensis]